MNTHLPDPRLNLIYRLEASVGDPQDVGDIPACRRRIVPLTGGTFRRPELCGTQLPSCFAVFVDQVPAAAQAARTARVSCRVACSGHGPRNLAAIMTRRSLTAMSS